MNTLRITLFISLAIQVCLSAGILATAEEGPIALFTIPIALFALIAIDLSRWLRPYPALLNVVALGGLAAAYREFQGGGEFRLLAGAHMMSYIMWTFLLQEKDLRRMWWMFALSVLQVALAAVLTIQPWFGAALLLYTIVTIWTMSVLSLTRAALLANPDMLLRPVSNEVVSRVRVWGAATAQNGFRTDDRGRWISPRFLGGATLTFALSLVIGLLFFILTPRVWIGSLNTLNERTSKGGRTGFAENVRLGDIGRMIESDELVMEIEGIDLDDQQPLKPAQLMQHMGADPYFRGAYLNNYGREGAWAYDPQGVNWEPPRLRLDWTRDNLVLLKILLQPSDSVTLFLHERTLRVGSADDTEELVFNEQRNTLERPRGSNLGQTFEYRMILLDQQRDWSKLWRDVQWRMERFRGMNPNLLTCLSNTNPRLTELARQVCGLKPGEQVTDAEQAARQLEAFLRDSPEFSYTLDLSVEDPSIDPVEDFLFNRKKGHCEYFATALALMLRGVGIPSRLASGFKGAEYNSKSGRFEVRALHAHAWVEGYVQGGWVTLDATPGERETQIADKAKDAQNSLVEQTRGAWFRGMNYSQAQQEELVYAPLRNIGLMVKENMSGLMHGNLPVLMTIKSAVTSPDKWNSGVAPFVIATLLVLGLLGAWMTRGLWRTIGRWQRRRETERRRAATIEFYERLLQYLRRAGIIENPAQTPREMAAVVESRFADQLSGAGLGGGIGRLVESFYVVRFGGEPLSATQLQDIEATLEELERKGRG